MAISKGILLAGGHGRRLFPLTVSVSKHLLPVFDKPMIYYPLTTLMMAGVTEVLVITQPRDQSAYRELLGDGSRWGLQFSYDVQESPAGIAEALIIGRSFIADDQVILALGDNVFFGSGLSRLVRHAAAENEGATILAYKVKNPDEYAVVETSDDGHVVSLEEKPLSPRSDFAVPGFYFYDSQAPEIARYLSRSDRGELEITDVNREYLRLEQLDVKVAPRGIAWLDAGTHDGLHKASSFVQAVQERQGLLVASPDEVALRMGLIDFDAFQSLIIEMGESAYRSYLELVSPH